MKRRNFLRTLGLSTVGVGALGALAGPASRYKQAVTTRGTAENVIYVNLAGAPSHVDTFDLKKGAWTPADFEPGQVGNIELAGALFPNLLNQTDKFSLLRCITGEEAVHDRARYVLETAHTFNPTFSKEQPHIGSVIALETAAKRKAGDILPAFLSINSFVQGSGMLDATYAPFVFSSEDGVTGLEHPAGQTTFDKRWAALTALDPNRGGDAAHGAVISAYDAFFKSGETMMYEPEVATAFSVTDEERARYGDTNTGSACATAVKVLAMNKGTHMIQITHGSWDHHYDIYDRNVAGNLYDLCGQLDPALASMLADLAATPGVRGGSLLDETLVVVTGEFGRTPGDVTNNLGRDHYQYAWSALMAGAGVSSGQTFGGTDSGGSFITDPFWSRPRYITMQDVVATMYSSMGIDWTKEIEDTPSGRVYEYTPKYEGEAGYYTDILELFQG